MEGILPAIIFAAICFFVMRKGGCCGGHKNSLSKTYNQEKSCCSDKKMKEY